MDVTTPDGRTLCVHDGGDPDGVAVVYHHGTPSDGALFEPWVADAAARGIRLIGVDRPGYGGSTPHPGRRVADVAADVVAIADGLGIERFATWGVSGGGPHTLACAALLGERCVASASLAGVAPFEAPGLNYLAGMGRDNWVEFGAALVGPDVLDPLLEENAQEMLRADPAELAESIRTLVSDADQAALDAGFAEFWAAGFPHAFAQGIDGWRDDNLAFVEPFGFDLAAITVPVLVMHGHFDQFVPVSHGKWLAAHVAGAEGRILPEDGHMTLIVDRIGDVHEWLLARF